MKKVHGINMGGMSKKEGERWFRTLLPRLLAQFPDPQIEKVTPLEGATHSAYDKIIELKVSPKDGDESRRYIRLEVVGPDRNLLAFYFRSLRKWQMIERFKALIGKGHPLVDHIPGPFDVFVATKGEAASDRGDYVHMPNPADWEGVYVFSSFTPNAESWLDRLIRRRSKEELSERSIAEIDKIARLLAKLHRPVATGREGELEKLCQDGQLFIKEKLHRRISLNEHPLSFEEMHKFGILVERSMSLVKPNPARLHPSWGDLHLGNILITSGEDAVFIDPRTNEEFPDFFDSGLDVGFLFTDLWWCYRIWENPAFKKRAFLLLERYEQYTGDKEICQAIVHSGLPYRSSFRLDPKHTKDATAEQVRLFFKDVEWWIGLGTIIDV